MTFTEMIEKAMGDSEPVTPSPRTAIVLENQCRICKLWNREDLNQHGECPYCAAAIERGYYPAYKQGRNRNGAHRDAGTLYHARPVDDDGVVGWKSLCGTQPQGQSGGWSYISDHDTSKVTCKRCLKKLGFVECLYCDERGEVRAGDIWADYAEACPHCNGEKFLQAAD